MNKIEITDDENNILKEIHNKILPKRKKYFDVFGFTNNSKTKFKSNIGFILRKTKKILDDNKIFNYNISKYYIEFQQRNCGFEKEAKRTFD